ncbi:MAG: 2,3-bisphosphoglycerate-dependent phosphoglycerate mutase [Candidatus Pacebacteria bacterium]|nr:2,3-bisphosphoglycerate-dependent phosphoglycerate mutase [Candidatus Paceibacterota bacterium]
MRKIVLLRHGESVWNRDNMFAGWVDVELSDRGVRQAKEAAVILKKEGFLFDTAFASILKRAVHTLEIVLKEMNLSDVVIIEDERLNERHYGSLQGVNKKEAVRKFGEEQVRKWRRGYEDRPPEGESLADVVERVELCWQEKIIPAIREGKSILISAHGNSLRALVKILDRLSGSEVEKLNIPTGIPLVYELNEALEPVKHYYLAEPGQAEEAIKAVAEETKI